MERVIELGRTLRDAAWWVWRHKKFALWLIGSTGLALACREIPPSEVTVIVTEVVELEGGEEFVITRVMTQTIPTPTPTPAPTIPVAPLVVTLDVPLIGGYGPLDPQRVTDKNSATLIENLYAGLTNFNFRTNQVEPELADSWEVSADGLTWRFFLREDVYWVRAGAATAAKDGLATAEVVRSVTAGDVVFALQRACSAPTKTPDVFILFVIAGCQQLGSSDARIAQAALANFGARALGNQTLEIRLRQPASYLLALTTLPVFRPIPAELVNNPDVNWLDPPVLFSSGPFFINPRSRLEATGAGATLVLQRSPGWPLPFAGGDAELVNVYLIDNVEDAFGRWDNKELDIAPLPRREADRFLENPLIRPPVVTTDEVFYLGFNLDSPAFSVPEVRRAFSAAIDRDRLISEVYAGAGAPMRHFTPPGAWMAPPINEVGVGFSPDYARLQLAASGFGSCRLLGDIRYLITSSDVALQHAESLRRMWVEELGCDEHQIQIEQVQFGALLADTRRDAGARRPDIWDLAWASFYPDAHNWLYDVLHCTGGENRPNRRCSEVDDLLAQAAVAPLTERQTLYRQAENQFFGDGGLYPIAPLYVRGELLLTQVWLQYTPSLFGGEHYDSYFIEQEAKNLERGQ